MIDGLIKEIAFQKEEQIKLAAKLCFANKELSFECSEKAKRVAELVLANIELAHQSGEKKRRAAELGIANSELAFQKKEKGKRAIELRDANAKLVKATEHLKDYIKNLEEMLFMISHKVRQPVTSILGLTNLMQNYMLPSNEVAKLIGYIGESAKSLDAFTIELTHFISKLRNKNQAALI